MWEEGVHIYGTPGVPNNFPIHLPKKKSLLWALILLINSTKYKMRKINECLKDIDLETFYGEE